LLNSFISWGTTHLSSLCEDDRPEDKPKNPRGKFRTRKTALLCDAGGDVFAPPSDPTAAEAPPPEGGFELGVDLGPALPSDAPRLPEQSSAIKYNQNQSTAIKGNQG
jgi:hypothetical protein